MNKDNGKNNEEKKNQNDAIEDESSSDLSKSSGSDLEGDDVEEEEENNSNTINKSKSIMDSFNLSKIDKKKNDSFEDEYDALDDDFISDTTKRILNKK